jgi:flagellar hook protein FlgE
MGLYSSFYASLSGLSANASALSVIGNNLANLNTVGFKGSSSSFQDLFASASGASGTQGNGDPSQIGLGTRLGAISQDFSQGSFQSSGNATDMAIQGSGFFTLRTKDGSQAFSRSGNFSINKNGVLSDPSGNQVMGWNRTDQTLSTNGPTSPVIINVAATSPPSATTSIGTTTNLSALAAKDDVFSAPVQIYDSLGASHSVLFTYKKGTLAGDWDVSVTTDGGATVDVGNGTNTMAMHFDSTGKLTSPTTNPSLSFTGWTNGATSPSTKWEVFPAATPLQSSITSFASASATSNTAQNGYGAGSVNSLTVDQNGVVIGNFTNGQTLSLAQVAITTFPNQSGLTKNGSNTWGETESSGVPNVGAANKGGRGAVLGANLELSNVDVATEFTALIIAQRGYQANSRLVTTSDQLLQETLNLKQ